MSKEHARAGLLATAVKWRAAHQRSCTAIPNQTKLTKMGSDPFSNHISIYPIVADNRLHVTQSLLEAKAIIMEKKSFLFWRLEVTNRSF